MKILLFGATAVALGLATIDPVVADDAPPLDDRFSVQLGGFLVSTDTTLRVDGSAGDEGTEFDWEGKTGTGDNDRFRVDALWRITPRHHLRAMYFDNNQRGERALEEEIEFQGEIYPVGARLEAEHQFEVLQLAYEYAFLRRENYEVAASIGIHNVDMSFRLAAELTVDGEPLAGGSLDESASTSGPLPVIGLRGIWRFADKWYLDAHGQFFALEIDEYDGELIDAQASIMWQTFRNVGFGIGYNYFDVRVDVDGNRFDGRLEWEYSGLMLFARASF
ncbi:MAG TPA: hypothetical protein VLT59_15630 [Steroidobacteraceae bacterium]|nr:hypothetical protein [Steroidobacteraceae bacterium]